MDHLTYVLAAAARGIGIVPCDISDGKKRPHPQFAPQAYHDASTNERQIRSWAHRGVEVFAFASNPQRFVVIDYDRQDPPANQPHTYTVKSPNGWHYYFAGNDRIPGMRRVRIYKDTDILTGKGIVIAPYARTGPGDHQIYLPVVHAPLAPFPERILAKLLAIEKSNAEQTKIAAPYTQNYRSDLTIDAVLDACARAKNRTFLPKSGVEYSTFCPGHDDRSPSLRVHREKNVCYCYGPCHLPNGRSGAGIWYAPLLFGIVSTPEASRQWIFTHVLRKGF